MKKIIPYIAIVLAMLIWAGSGIAVQHSLLFLRPFTLIVLRFTIAVLLMLAVGLIARGSDLLSLQAMRKQDIPLFLLAGIMQPVLYFIFETYCYRSLASPTIAEAMLSTAPLIAPFLAFLILRERVTKYNIIGMVTPSVSLWRFWQSARR